MGPSLRSPPLPAALAKAIAQRFTRILEPPPASSYRDFVVAGIAVGCLDAQRAAYLGRWPTVFRAFSDRIELQCSLADEAARTAALHEVCEGLAAAGLLSTWRAERYAVAPSFGEAPLFHIERAAARYFGVWTHAAHVNGVVDRGSDVAIWFARRSPQKAIDPGLLDNLVGGGISEGFSVDETVIKESWEEAGIDAPLAEKSVPTGVLRLIRAQTQGLQRERVFSHDLWLPSAFVPANQDGEAVEHRLLSMVEAAECIASDEVTADASLVVLSFLLRCGAVGNDDPSLATLRGFCASPDDGGTTQPLGSSQAG